MLCANSNSIFSSRVQYPQERKFSALNSFQFSPCKGVYKAYFHENSINLVGKKRRLN